MAANPKTAKGRKKPPTPAVAEESEVTPDVEARVKQEGEHHMVPPEPEKVRTDSLPKPNPRGASINQNGRIAISLDEVKYVSINTGFSVSLVHGTREYDEATKQHVSKRGVYVDFHEMQVHGAKESMGVVSLAENPAVRRGDISLIDLKDRFETRCAMHFMTGRIIPWTIWVENQRLIDEAKRRTEELQKAQAKVYQERLQKRGSGGVLGEAAPEGFAWAEPASTLPSLQSGIGPDVNSNSESLTPMSSSAMVPPQFQGQQGDVSSGHYATEAPTK